MLLIIVVKHNIFSKLYLKKYFISPPREKTDFFFLSKKNHPITIIVKKKGDNQRVCCKNCREKHVYTDVPDSYLI